MFSSIVFIISAICYILYLFLVTFESVNSILKFCVILFTLNIDNTYVVYCSYFLHLPYFDYKLILKIENKLTSIIHSGRFCLLVIQGTPSLF